MVAHFAPKGNGREWDCTFCQIVQKLTQKSIKSLTGEISPRIDTGTMAWYNK